MPDNPDLRADLTDGMVFEREERDGTRIRVLAHIGQGEGLGKSLYRSMDLDEARNWLGGQWLPGDSGIPWSTNYRYSRDQYLKGARTVQLEGPAGDIIDRMKATGTTPKYEGDGETWGTGPVAELGRKPSRAANKALKRLHAELSEQGAVTSDFPTKSLAKEARNIQNACFRAMFRDKMARARVVTRRFPAGT